MEPGLALFHPFAVDPPGLGAGDRGLACAIQLADDGIDVDAVEIERAQLDKLGVVVSADAAQAVLSVPAGKVNVVVRDALATLPVVDLTIEDPPLEEVMREMFSAQRETRDRAVP